MTMASAAIRLLPLELLLLILLFIVVGASSGEINSHGFTIEEATIDEIQRAFTDHKLTSRQLVDFYIDRIGALNPDLRGVVEVNPDARDQADEADRQRKEHNGRFRSELHGIPILLKESIATKDKLNTTAGSYALLGSVVPRDAHVVAKLRNAGAVILGKASLSEWYSFRSLGKIPNGWSARSGQGKNPYLTTADPCGSSSGSAISVAANMVSVSLGSETHGSILCPSDVNSVVGFKPTVGLTSRAGVVPVMLLLDTIGPITKTVADAVHVLDAIVGFDPRDSEATQEAAKFIPAGGYKQFLKQNGLKGKIIGVVKKPFLTSQNLTFIKAFEKHLSTLRECGATIVDNLEIANISTIMDVDKSGELTLMLAGFKVAVNEYLKELLSSPVRSLADVIAFNENNADLEKIKEYGQETFIDSEKTNGLGEREQKAIKLLGKLSEEGLEKLVRENNLDAMVTPGGGCISVLAIGGYPGISVPAGYHDNGTPFGICFGGLKGTEPKLIEIAYAFEQATRVRKPPFSQSLKSSDEFLFGALK